MLYIYIYIYIYTTKFCTLANVKFAKVVTCNVLMPSHRGFYKQVGRLAMGSQSDPHLANGWVHQCDHIIHREASPYARYMDNVIINIKRMRLEKNFKQLIVYVILLSYNEK